MTGLIERYVYDVTRRLPEKDREEVGRELTANIYDMLSDDPGDEEVASVLNSLGAPRLLAEKYRHKPNYLISPAVYDDYIRAIKWITPLVGGILLILGIILGIVDSLQASAATVPAVVENIKNIVIQGLSMGISGAFYALFWTTVGFAIADRAGKAKQRDAAAWSVRDLPEQAHEEKGRISLSDGIAELVLTVVFTIVALLFLTDAIPFSFILLGTSTTVYELFAASFVALLIPVLVVGGVVKVILSVVKIVKRRWSALVCITALVCNAIGIGLLVLLAQAQEILSPGFVSFLETQGWWQPNSELLGNLTAEVPAGQLIFTVIVALVIIAILLDCLKTIRRTIRANSR